MQHQLHSELLDIAEELTCFDVNVRYPGAFKLVNVDVARIATTGVQCNKTGDVIKAATIADFAWKVLECGSAVLQGGYEGVKNVGSYALENPHEVLLYGIAPELMAGYQTLKLIHSVGSMAIDLARVGFSKDAAKKLENATFQGVLYGTSSIVVQICLNSLLNKFSVKFVGKSKESLVAVVAGECPQTYAAFKDVCKARARRSSDAIKNVKNKLFKDTKKNKVGSDSKIKVPVLFSDVKQAETEYREVINSFRDHIFVEKHKLLEVSCKSQESLMEEVIAKVMTAAKDLALCEGNNQILTRINNVVVTIRVNIFQNKFRSTNVFVGTTDRICENQINLL